MKITFKTIILALLLILALPCVLKAQPRAALAPIQSKADKEAAAAAVAGEAQKPRGKTFAPVSGRDPFLSQQEVESIEAARLAEQKRIETERKRLEDAEKARIAAIERQRLLEEELRKNPAREVINKIRVDGIVGSEAIINGQFKGVGDSVLGARITKVTENGVTLIYKGQTFVKRMPVSEGIGVH